VAAEARVGRLVLTHFSARFSEQAHRLVEEAESIFPAVAAEDGSTFEVPLAEEPSGGPV
jgi:ribonuclease BN (tRNA processing enzyme)